MQSDRPVEQSAIPEKSRRQFLQKGAQAATALGDYPREAAAIQQALGHAEQTGSRLMLARPALLYNTIPCSFIRGAGEMPRRGLPAAAKA